MSNNRFSLSFIQYVLLIYTTQIGIGILTIPRDLFVSSGVDGWIAIIFGWAVTNIISFFILKTMEKHPDQTLFDLLPKYFGKWIGNAILLLWLIYTLFVASYTFIYIVHLIKVWVLPNTNPILLGILFIIPIYMITKDGLPMISRFAEFAFLSSLWVYPLIIFTSKKGIWLNLFPIAREGLFPIIKSTPVTLISFLGFEIAFFLYPHLQNKKKAFKGIFIANTMTAVILILAAILCYIRLSDMELTNAVWPTLDLIKLVRFPFLERLEIIYISAYIVFLFMTLIPYFYITLLGSATLAQRSIQTPTLVVILILWFIALFYPVISLEFITMLEKWIRNFGYVFAFLFPIILWLYSKIYLATRKGGLEG